MKLKSLFFYFTGILLILIVANAQGQQKKQLSLSDAMLKARTTLAPENLKQLQFIEKTTNYAYIKTTNGTDVWYTGSSTSAMPDSVLLTKSALNQKLKIAGLDTVTNFPLTQFSIDSFTINYKGGKYRFSRLNNGYTQLLPTNTTHKTAFDEGKKGYYAYVDNYNLLVQTNSNTRTITTDGSDDIVYGQSVHRDEFGINKGTFWSPSGNLLAFYRMDQSMVNSYPIISWDTIPAVNHNIRYPMAGTKSHVVTIGVYNTQTNQTVYLKTGLPADQYLTNIAWSPDDKTIYVAVLNRAQNHMKLNEFNADNGNFIRTLYEEKDDKYVEPLTPIQFLPNNMNQFLLQSRKDGWNHLYLFDKNTGSQIKQLTKGSWEVLEVKGFNVAGNKLYFIATQASPIERHLYELDLKTFAIKAVTQQAGVHNTIIHPTGIYVLDAYSNTVTPRIINIIENTPKKVGIKKNLLQAANPLTNYDVSVPEIFTFKSSSAELYGRMYKPVNFDSTKKYPLLVYWYGGPHAQLILNSWNAGAGDYWFSYLTQQGYVVFSLDTRGSANRGKAFEQTIFREVGKPEMEDLENALQHLTKSSYIDTANMGLFGWSFGGFMTTDYVLNHPKTFKAAVAGGPVINWSMYEIMYGERYMDTPEENPEGYKKTNLTLKAKNLQDHLMLIHGTQDPVVVWQHSINFVKSCVDAGVQVDYMVYTGHEHNVLGKDRLHLYQKVTDYFNLYLK